MLIKNKLVHGNNLTQKESHTTKYRDADSRQYLQEIRQKYDAWHKANMDLVGPKSIAEDADREIINERVKLLSDYKDFIDAQKYAEKFDSRSNLHSSVLEEFMFYLFKDLIVDFGEHSLIGKSHAFKDIFFNPPSYTDMLNRPFAKIEKKDHDFVIGATYQATFDSSTPLNQDPQSAHEVELVEQEKPGDYDTVTVTETTDSVDIPVLENRIESEVETHLFDVPAVAIECKTYLDKSMLEGSSVAADQIKARHPNGIYIVVMEYIKLTDAVNLRKYKVDQIYVLRKQKNTDREYRYAPDYVKNPIDANVVEHLFQQVRTHLTSNWQDSIGSVLERGWLIE